MKAPIRVAVTGAAEILDMHCYFAWHLVIVLEKISQYPSTVRDYTNESIGRCSNGIK